MKEDIPRIVETTIVGCGRPCPHFRFGSRLADPMRCALFASEITHAMLAEGPFPPFCELRQIALDDDVERFVYEYYMPASVEAAVANLRMNVGLIRKASLAEPNRRRINCLGGYFEANGDLTRIAHCYRPYVLAELGFVSEGAVYDFIDRIALARIRELNGL